MKTEDLIWDVRHILMALEVTTTVTDGEIIDKLAFYRMAWIKDYYTKNREILEEWYSFVDSYTADTVWHIKVGPPAIDGAQFSIPRVIKMPNFTHVRIVDSANASKLTYGVPYLNLIMMIEVSDPMLARFDFFALKDTRLFVYPSKNFDLYAILQEPTLAKTLLANTVVPHNQLKAGLTYKVSNYAAYYWDTAGNVQTFSPGDTFVGLLNKPDWTDDDPNHPAIVTVFSGFQMDHNYFMEYPLDVQGAQYCILEMLTKDFNLRNKSISDVVQDGQDQFKILTARS